VDYIESVTEIRPKVVPVSQDRDSSDETATEQFLASFVCCNIVILLIIRSMLCW